MRLICPNCSAQYDVEDSVIPDNGRDVQCSNCGHTWYQRPASRDAKPDKDVSAEHAPVAADAPDEHQSSEDKIEAEASTGLAEPSETESEAVAEEAKLQETDEPEDKNVKPARLGDDVASILREEADREAAVRSAETGGLETQPDLGLNGGTESTDTAVKERMARLRGLDDDLGAAVAAAAVAGGPRKDLLPDIEEINSTLTASAAEAEEGSQQGKQEKRQRSGFTRGFAVTVIIFALLLLVYLYAGRITESFPAASSALAAYVSWVDALREAVDAMMLRAVEKLTALVTQIGGDGTS